MPKINKKLKTEEIQNYKKELDDIRSKLLTSKQTLINLLDPKLSEEDWGKLIQSSSQNSNHSKILLEKLKLEFIQKSSYCQFLEKLQTGEFEKFKQDEINQLDIEKDEINQRKNDIQLNQQIINKKLIQSIDKIEQAYSNCDKDSQSSMELINQIALKEEDLSHLENHPFKKFQSELDELNGEKDIKENELEDINLQNEELMKQEQLLKQQLQAKKDAIKLLEEKKLKLQQSQTEKEKLLEEKDDNLQTICPWLEQSITFLQSLKDSNQYN